MANNVFVFWRVVSLVFVHQWIIITYYYYRYYYFYFIRILFIPLYKNREPQNCPKKIFQKTKCEGPNFLRWTISNKSKIFRAICLWKIDSIGMPDQSKCFEIKNHKAQVWFMDKSSYKKYVNKYCNRCGDNCNQNMALLEFLFV